MIRVCLPVLFLLSITGPTWAQESFEKFQTPSLLKAVDSLESRMDRLTSHTSEFPPVVVDHTLPSNARFIRDSIFLGALQRDFHSFGDTLSILYHEYLHKVFWEAQRFPFQFDSQGQPLRIETGTFYTYTPPPEQTDRDLENLRFYYSRVEPELVGEALEQRLVKMRSVLSQPQQLPFVYAPSNLTLEEIEAYTGQLEGEELGLYTLSETAKKSIQFRIYQLKQTYELRRQYEENNGLDMRGNKVVEDG